jgi:hypothetical protein
VTVGFKRSVITSLHENGFFVEGQFGGGLERSIDVNAVRIQQAHIFDLNALETTMKGHAALGYQWMTGQGVISAGLGVEGIIKNDAATLTQTSSNDVNLGGRVDVDVWHHVTPQTLIQFNMTGSTAQQSVWSRLRGGYAFFEGTTGFFSMMRNAYVGPEMSIYHEFSTRRDYEQIRVGIHATNITIGARQANISAGVYRDTDKRQGGYVNVGLAQKW